MKRRAFVAAVVFVLAGVYLCIPALAASQSAAPEADKAALAFAGAIVNGDLPASWQLLSPKSRSGMTAMQWQEQFRRGAPSRMPSGNDLLRALATSEEPPTIGEALVQDGEALVTVSGTVRITQDLILVKERNSWFVDLAASDEVNSRDAARAFIEAVGSASASLERRPVRTPQTSLPMLRALLAPEAKSYYVLESKVDGDRADVTLACDIPVSLVLRAVRSGPGWMVDLTRPMVPTSPTSPDPLKEAAEIDIQNTCQDQLRQLTKAFQMYAAAYDDTFPDASRWLDQLRPFLGEASNALHCPADKTPGVSYAMNRNLSGKKRSLVANQSATPLLFESTLHSANPADTGGSWPSPAFHAAGNMVLYVDGSVRPSPSTPSFAVTEGQRPAPPMMRPQPQSQGPPQERRRMMPPAQRSAP